MASDAAARGKSGRRFAWQTASRGLRFIGGLAAGVLILPVLGCVGLGGMYVAGLVGHLIYATPQGTEWVVLRGADLSDAGATTVGVEWNYKAARITCRDACDDLVDVDKAATRLEVRNARGECIVCREQGRWPWYVKHPNAWLVGGRPLSVRERDPS